MLGGLAKRVSLIEKLKSQDGSLLVVDSGNLLTGTWAGANQKQSLTKARLISRAYIKMGAAAINVGDLDLLVGLPFLHKEASRGLPLVSSNLVDPSTSAPIFKPYVIKKCGSVRVAFFGLLSPDVRTDIYKEEGRRFLVTNPVTAAQEMIRILRDKADVIILLSALSSHRQQDVIRGAPGINFVIGGRDGRYIQSPLWEGQSPILESYKYGMYAGKLQLAFLDASSPYIYERKEEKTGRHVPRADGSRTSEESLSRSNRFRWTLIPLAPFITEDKEVSDWIRKAGIEKD